MAEIVRSNGVEDNYSGVNIISPTLSATNGLKNDADIEKVTVSSSCLTSPKDGLFTGGNSLSVDDRNIALENVTADELSVHSNTDKTSPIKPRQETLADWWILGCAFLFIFLAGFNFGSYSVLYIPLTELFDTTRAAVGWIQSIEIALSHLLGLLISHPLSVYGCRKTALIGSTLIVVGGTLSCLAPNLGWMYFLKAFVSGVGLSSCMLASNVIIQQRFDAHRGLASSIFVIGFNVGNFISPPLVEYLLEQYSTRGTLALLGAIQVHRIPLALQLRTPTMLMPRGEAAIQKSEKKSQSLGKARSLSICCHRFTSYLKGSLDFSLLRHPSLMLFCIVGVLQKFLVYSYIPHTANWAMAAGLSRQVSVWMVSVTSLTALAQRLVVAVISDRACVSRLTMYAFGLLLSVFSVLPLLISPGFAATFVSVITFGLHCGQ